jgi:uncharacterized protein YerC
MECHAKNTTCSGFFCVGCYGIHSHLANDISADPYINGRWHHAKTILGVTSAFSVWCTLFQWIIRRSHVRTFRRSVRNFRYNIQMDFRRQVVRMCDKTSSTDCARAVPIVLPRTTPQHMYTYVKCRRIAGPFHSSCVSTHRHNTNICVEMHTARCQFRCVRYKVWLWVVTGMWRRVVWLVTLRRHWVPLLLKHTALQKLADSIVMCGTKETCWQYCEVRHYRNLLTVLWSAALQKLVDSIVKCGTKETCWQYCEVRHYRNLLTVLWSAALEKLADSTVRVTENMLWFIHYCCFSFSDTQIMHIEMSMSFSLSVNRFKAQDRFCLCFEVKWSEVGLC